MTKKSRFLSVIMNGTLCFILIVLQVLQMSIPTFATEKNSSDEVTRSVTTEDEFIAALNDTTVDVIHLQNEITLSRSTDGMDNAFVINRSVTITGEGTNGGLQLERAGIVLGGAVTFDNMSIYFANPVRNAIIANGYTLTLNNISNGGSSYNIDIFGGGITDYNGGNPSEIPLSGTETNIIIKGSNDFTGVKANIAGGNIYAGSLSDVGSAVADVPNEYSGNVSITIEKDASGFGKIFAHGARENRDGGYPDEWKSSADLYKVSGEVNIFLHTCKNIVVDGATGGTKNAKFTYKDYGKGYLCSPTLENISGIALLPSDEKAKSYLAPCIKGECSFQELSVPGNTRLSFVNMDVEAISASSYTGGGEIVFSEKISQVFSVTEEISGITKVAVGGVTADGMNSTGTVVEGNTYITVAVSDADDYSFELLPDYNKYNMVFENDGNGNWVTKTGESSIIINEIAEIADIEIAEFENDEWTTEISIPFNVTYATENENNFLGDIPMYVTVNGKEASMEFGYFGYQYATGMTSDDIYMGFSYDTDKEILYIANGESYEHSVPAGRYEISITIPAKYMESGETNTISFVVTVTCTEHRGGTATCQSKATCDVCGISYGELNQQKHTGKTYFSAHINGNKHEEFCQGCNVSTGNLYLHSKGEAENKCVDCEAEIVASVTHTDQTEVYYTSFDTALSGAQDSEGSVLKLFDNVTNASVMTIDGGTFTIDLNDKTITNTSTNTEAVFRITDGTVTIKGNGKISRECGSTNCGSGIEVTGGNVHVKNCTIISMSTGINQNGGSLCLEDVDISGYSLTAVVAVTNANLKIMGSTSICNIYNSSTGIMIYAYDGAEIEFAHITNGGYTIHNNTSADMNVILPKSGYDLFVNDERKATIGAQETATVIKAHEHSWNYTAENGVITAVCIAENCDLSEENVKIAIVVPNESDLCYDGAAKNAVVNISVDGIFEVPTVSYTSQSGEVLEGAPFAPGTYTASITMGEGDGAITANVEFTIRPLLLDETMVSLSQSEYIYDGNAKEPPVTVICNGNPLMDKDYDVTYSKNLNAGTAVVVVTGKGNYSGKVTKNFTIHRRNAQITVSKAVYDKIFGDLSFTLDVADTNEEADVQYYVVSSKDLNNNTVENDAVVTVQNNVVTIRGTGTAIIQVVLGQSTNYNAAESRTITINVEKAHNQPKVPAVGTIHISNDGTATYKVTTSDLAKGTVTYIAPKDKKQKKVIIPTTVVIDGVLYKVTAIGKNAFKGNKNIKSVTIGKNVKTIDKSAFEGCKQLTSVTIGKSVTMIGTKAFYGCTRLKTLTIKSTKLTAKKIGSKAFSKTPKSMTVKVPKKKFKTYKSMLIKKGVNKKGKFKKM